MEARGYAPLRPVASEALRHGFEVTFSLDYRRSDVYRELTRAARPLGVSTETEVEVLSQVEVLLSEEPEEVALQWPQDEQTATKPATPSREQHQQDLGREACSGVGTRPVGQAAGVSPERDSDSPSDDPIRVGHVRRFTVPFLDGSTGSYTSVIDALEKDRLIKWRQMDSDASPLRFVGDETAGSAPEVRISLGDKLSPSGTVAGTEVVLGFDYQRAVSTHWLSCVLPCVFGAEALEEAMRESMRRNLGGSWAAAMKARGYAPAPAALARPMRDVRVHKPFADKSKAWKQAPPGSTPPRMLPGTPPGTPPLGTPPMSTAPAPPSPPAGGEEMKQQPTPIRRPSRERISQETLPMICEGPAPAPD